ncbi:MAG: 50S ribosomal protein L6 [Proteobacteria bacterium]|nr:50S ribosomal protein L6 [Pseudomonadota bacterium]MDA1132253.1 50S ribosomal protein L6 [Pseudomonadota bacterium]
MSRIGKYPIPVPGGVEVRIDGKVVSAKGKLGQLSMTLMPEVTAELRDNTVVVRAVNDDQRSRSMWGMQRTLVANLIEGVSEGFSRDLEILGVGYRAQVQGNTLQMQLGFSHDVNYPIPEGIQITCEKPTSVKVFGADKQLVGQVAAEIRGWRPPEPYKGKGIRLAGEYVHRKEGKKK